MRPDGWLAPRGNCLRLAVAPGIESKYQLRSLMHRYLDEKRMKLLSEFDNFIFSKTNMTHRSNLLTETCVLTVYDNKIAENPSLKSISLKNKHYLVDFKCPDLAVIESKFHPDLSFEYKN